MTGAAWTGIRYPAAGQQAPFCLSRAEVLPQLPQLLTSTFAAAAAAAAAEPRCSVGGAGAGARGSASVHRHNHLGRPDGCEEGAAALAAVPCRHAELCPGRPAGCSAR